MCTVLLPPGVNPIAVKYIISYIISYHIISYHIDSMEISIHALQRSVYMEEYCSTALTEYITESDSLVSK
jgi:hypothetical protein